MLLCTARAKAFHHWQHCHSSIVCESVTRAHLLSHEDWESTSCGEMSKERARFLPKMSGDYRFSSAKETDVITRQLDAGVSLPHPSHNAKSECSTSRSRGDAKYLAACISFCDLCGLQWVFAIVFFIHTYRRGKRVLRDLRWFIRHLSSVVKSAGLNKFSYLQVPGSNPAENTSSVRFTWIRANRPSSKGAKLLFPIIKANLIKLTLKMIFPQVCHCERPLKMVLMGDLRRLFQTRQLLQKKISSKSVSFVCPTPAIWRLASVTTMSCIDAIQCECAVEFRLATDRRAHCQSWHSNSASATAAHTCQHCLWMRLTSRCTLRVYYSGSSCMVLCSRTNRVLFYLRVFMNC